LSFEHAHVAHVLWLLRQRCSHRCRALEERDEIAPFSIDPIARAKDVSMADHEHRI
jgi:hypothetical protein